MPVEYGGSGWSGVQRHLHDSDMRLVDDAVGIAHLEQAGNTSRRRHIACRPIEGDTTCFKIGGTGVERAIVLDSQPAEAMSSAAPLVTMNL